MSQSQALSASAVDRAGPPESPDLAQEFRDYAYIVSHDLGAPARLMVEFARLLGQKQSAFADEEDRMLIREIMDNGEKMRGMMQGLLGYSRLNTLAAPHVLVDTKKIAEHAGLLMREKLKARKGRLTFGALPHLMADPDQIMQLFSFLIDNAIKFARPGVAPDIHLESDGHPGGWQFSLRDNGIGMARDDWGRIFKPFQKLNRDADYPGVGMGLALARKITNLHGGRLWVESSSPEGTVMRFTLRGS